MTAAPIYITCCKLFNAASACVVATSTWPCLPSSIASFKWLMAFAVCGFALTLSLASACASAASACVARPSARPILAIIYG